MKISITGDLGSGKSTVSKILSDKLQANLFSTGTIQRKIAGEMGLSTLQLNLISETNNKIDERVDAFLIDLNNTSDQFVIDSRLAWHFIPSSFKIYLHVDINVAAERVINDSDRQCETYEDITTAKENLIKRKESENKRFINLYKVDCSNYDNYDCIVDTSFTEPETIASIILSSYKKWLGGQKYNKYWFSPKNLFPTHGVRQLSGEIAQNLCDQIKNKGFDENYPVIVIRSERFYYIFDGHKRVSASIFNGLELIPLEIITNESDEILQGITVNKYISNEVTLSMIYDWEDCHKFYFKEYPQL